MTRKLEFAGRISPVAEEVSLYFETSGYVKRVLVQQGDRIEAGDLLAELETEGLQDQIALAQSDLAVAQARLTQAEETNAYAIAQAEMSLELAQTQLAGLRALNATRTTYRRRGYARQVVAALVQAHVAAGQRVFLMVFQTNQAAVQLYEGLGFVRLRPMFLLRCRLGAPGGSKSDS